MKKVALITGSARGIGRAIALGMAEAGYRVVVHYRTSSAGAEAVVRRIAAGGGEACAMQADVTDQPQVERLVQQAAAVWGRLDVLVNNVGNYLYKPVSQVAPQEWHDIIGSNLHATFYACLAALPYLRQCGAGRIINLGFASLEHPQAKPMIAPYLIAKTGVLILSRSLAVAEARHGITVNVVSPGVMENSVQKLPLSKIPAGRYGRLDEVVRAVLFLAAAESGYLNGSNVEVAGGWNLGTG